MDKTLISYYANTFPNIERFYVNNGGKEFVQQLFLDKSNVLKKLSRIVSPHIMYSTYRIFEPLISTTVVTGLLLRALKDYGNKRLCDFPKVDRLYLNYAHLLVSRCKTAEIFNCSEFWLKEPFTNVY